MLASSNLTKRVTAIATGPTILYDVSNLERTDYIKRVSVHRSKIEGKHSGVPHYDLTINGLRLLLWGIHVYSFEKLKSVEGINLGMQEIAKKYSRLLPEVFGSRDCFDEMKITELVDDCLLLALYIIVRPDFEWEQIYRSEQMASRRRSIEHTFEQISPDLESQGVKTVTRPFKRTLSEARRDAHDVILNQFFLIMTYLDGVQRERWFTAVKKNPRLRNVYFAYLRGEKRRLPVPYERALNALKKDTRIP